MNRKTKSMEIKGKEQRTIKKAFNSAHPGISAMVDLYKYIGCGRHGTYLPCTMIQHNYFIQKNRGVLGLVCIPSPNPF